MTFHMNGRELKEKWLKQYQEEIFTHRDQREREKAKKLQEEQEYLNKINRELQEEQAKKFNQKKKTENDYINDYNRMINEKKKILDTKANVDNLSLELKSDERIKDLKNYINKLSEKVDKNMNNYVEYQKNSKNFSNPYDNLNYSPRSNDAETTTGNLVPDKNENGTIERNNSNNLNNFQLHEKPFNYSNSPSNRLDYISNRNYIQYKEVLRDYNNYNKSLISNKHKSQEDLINKKKKLIEERLKEIDNLNRLQIIEKLNKENTKSMYKDLLGDQIKTKATPIPSNYGKDLNSLNKDEYGFNNLIKSVPLIKPYSFNTRYELGDTDLEVNTILNPVHNYKYNKYLFENNSNKNYNYLNKFSNENYNDYNLKGNTLKLAGNSILQ